jgi:hypothetical protein
MLPNTAHRRRARAIFRRSRGVPRASARVCRLAQDEPMRSPIGQRLLVVARQDGPSDEDRQRILESVLAALRQLTSGAA